MSAPTIQFKILKDGAVIREESLTQDVIKIGRMASSHLQIDDESISRMHAVIEMGAQGEINIIDLGSAEGTVVNGEKSTKPNSKVATKSSWELWRWK